MLLSIQCRVYCSLAVTHLAWHGHATGPLLLLLLLLCIMAINPFCRCLSISIVNNNNPFVTHFNRANSVIATRMSIEHLDGDDGTLLLHINTFPVSPVVSVRCVSPTTTFWTLTWKASQHSTWWVVWVRAVHRYHSVFRHWWYMLFTLITFGNRFLSFCHLRLRMRIDFDPITLCMTLFYTPLGAMFCADISTRCWHWPHAICEIRWQSVNSLFIIIDKYLLWSPTTDRLTVPLWLHLFGRNCALSTSQHANNNNYSPIQIARIIFIGCICLACLYYVLIHSDSSLYFMFFFLVKCMHSATADCRSCSTKAKSIIVVAYR